MKKLGLALSVILMIVMIGCPSGPPPKDRTAGPTDERIAPKVEIIDHQYRGLKEVPEWVLMAQGELENLADFKDYFIFKEVTQGKDLKGVQVWASDFQVDSQISRLVSNRIKSKFAGAMVGSVDGADTYFEKIVQSVASAQVAGTRRHADYWILRRYKNPDGSARDVYEYYILVKVPEAEVKKAVARAFDQNPPKSENEVRARDQVKKIMDSDPDW